MTRFSRCGAGRQLFLTVLLAGVAGVDIPVQAAPIAVTSWLLKSRVYDGTGWQEVTDTSVRFPLQESLTAQAGSRYSTSTYGFQASDSAMVFRTDFQQQRGGDIPTGWEYTAGATGRLAIEFTATENAHYDISGLFTATGDNTGMHLRVLLNDARQNASFWNIQQGAVASGQGYEVGGMEGSNCGLEGSLSGDLEAGKAYGFYATYEIYPTAPDAGATANGWLLFQVTPEPATSLMLVSCCVPCLFRRHSTPAIRR
jgi:hypothetical protein